MLINTRGSTLESLPIFRALEFGNETFHFDCGVYLSRYSIERARCYEELCLRPLSQDLFSARAHKKLLCYSNYYARSRNHIKHISLALDLRAKQTRYCEFHWDDYCMRM